ncbi:MAG: hypothetical protein ACI8ZM_002995 [Crocinitomix sp.]|jgi:hypothetical protein
MTQIQNIKGNIERWNTIRNTDLGLKHLSSGFGFEISEADFLTWRDKDANSQIHVYLGIDENDQTRFYLVDSISDATNDDSTIEQHLIEKGFTKDNLPPDQGAQIIPELKVQQEDGMKRAFKWFLYCNVWFKNMQTEWQGTRPELKDQSGVVRVFSLPLANFIELFTNPKIHSAFVFFGIKDRISLDGIDRDNEIELLVAGVDYLQALETIANMDIQMKNVTIPHPPFPIEYSLFSLLKS